MPSQGFADFVRQQKNTQSSKTAVSTTQPQQKGDSFLKSLIKDPIKTLIVKPGVRAAQAAVGVYGAAIGNQKLQDVALEDTSIDIPILGHYDVEGQKGGVEGAKQIGSDALKTATYLAPAGAATRAGRIATGAATGYASDVASNLEQGKKGTDIIKPGVGTLLGTLIPSVGEVGSDVLSAVRKKAIQRSATLVDDLAGKIAQGSTDDVAKAKTALSSIDVDGVKTYKELEQRFDDHITGLSNKVDETYNTNATKTALDKLTVSQKVGQETVSHNYVQDALDQLDNFYEKTNNVAKRSEITQLKNKAATEGLTAKEINDLARIHGKELNGFNANGELASGLTKQAAENTRSGVKETARNIFNNPAIAEADEQLSKLIRTRDLVSQTAEKVNQLKQKVEARGLGEKVGRLIFQIVDKFTGGGLKGFIQSFVPRGEGLKIMNALDLERNLSKNLKLLNELVQKDLPEQTMIQKLQEIIDNTPKSSGEQFIDTLKKGETYKDTVKAQTLEYFKPNPNKPIQVNRYDKPYPSYITPDQVKSETTKLEAKQNAGKTLDIMLRKRS